MQTFQVEITMFGFYRNYSINALSEDEAISMAASMLSAELGID